MNQHYSNYLTYLIIYLSSSFRRREQKKKRQLKITQEILESVLSFSCNNTVSFKIMYRIIIKTPYYEYNKIKDHP